MTSADLRSTHPLSSLSPLSRESKGIVGITAEGLGAADAKPGHERRQLLCLRTSAQTPPT